LLGSEPPDGSLVQWDEIADDFEWKTLVLGNGLSINVWPRFAYRSLYDHARDEGLTEQDRALFADTANFERVLGDISTAIRVGEVVGLDTAPLYTRYRSVQLALGNAIRDVHVRRSNVPTPTLARIRSSLTEFAWIFTTSYDLLLYWSMASGGRFAPFVDDFRYGEFDASRAQVFVGQIPVYYLHGALHLIVSGAGATRKLRQTTIRTLLEQFGQPIPGDPGARPLLVTEGSSRDKLRAIEGNAYLAHCLDRLRERNEPTVVFGSSLSDQDQHLVDALNEHPDRPVAVSMLPGAKRSLGPRQMDVYGRLDVETLVFFDATSHPLGSPELRALP
jgi:Domain of unknown function (DUF4917)